MAPDCQNEDDLKNSPIKKHIENVEDQNSDSDGWVPADFEIQLVGHGRQTHFLNENIHGNESNSPLNDNSSESSWPDTDEEYQIEDQEESLEGYLSIPLIVEEYNCEDVKSEEVTDTANKIDCSTTNMVVNKIIDSTTRESENVHLSSKDFDYTPVEKRELILDDEKISKIKDVMKKINITPPPWADKINDEKLSEILKEIIKK